VAGLSLMARAGGSGALWSGGSGNFTPLTPASALPSTAPIAQQAYGISGSGASTWDPRVSWFGSIGVGVVSVGLLAYLWWSLPR
jgi:hypothetical protein